MATLLVILGALCCVLNALASCGPFNATEQYRLVHSEGANSSLLHPFVGQRASSLLASPYRAVNLSPMGGFPLYGTRFHEVYASQHGYISVLRRIQSSLSLTCPPRSVAPLGINVYAALGNFMVEGVYSEYFATCARPPLHGPSQPCVVVEWRNATRGEARWDMHMYLYQGGEIAVELSGASEAKLNDTVIGVQFNKWLGGHDVDGVFAPCEASDSDTYVAVLFTQASCEFELLDAVSPPSGPCAVYDSRDAQNEYLLLDSAEENGATYLEQPVRQGATSVLGFPGVWSGGAFEQYILDVSDIGGFPLYGNLHYSLYVSAHGIISNAGDIGSDYYPRCPLPYPPFNGPVLRYGASGSRIYSFHSGEFDPLGGMFFDHFDPCPRRAHQGPEQPCIVVEWRDYTHYFLGDSMNVFTYLYPSGEIALELASAEAVNATHDFTQGAQNSFSDLGVSVCNSGGGPVQTNRTLVMFPSDACAFEGVTIGDLTGPCSVFDGIDFGRLYRFIHSAGDHSERLDAFVGQQGSDTLPGSSEKVLNLTSIGGFPFYGKHYNEVYVTPHGVISTETGAIADPFNYCPLPQNPSKGDGGRIFAFHAATYVDGIFSQHFEICPRAGLHVADQPCVLVEWRGRTYATGGIDPMWNSFAYLYPNGEIAIEVEQVSGVLRGSGTVGVMSEDWQYGVSSLCNEDPVPVDYVAVLFPEEACPSPVPTATPIPTPVPPPVPLSIVPLDSLPLIESVGVTFRKRIQFLVTFAGPTEVSFEHFTVRNCEWESWRPESETRKRDTLSSELADATATEWVATVSARCAGMVEITLSGVTGAVQYLPPCFLSAIT